MNAPHARKEKLTIRDLPDETLVYDLERHKAHCLNATAALVWKHCDGKTPLEKLAQILQETQNVPAPEAAVSLALEQLNRRYLLQGSIDPVSGPQRLSRREALKKVAATAIALPLVMTISAPLARVNASAELVGPCKTVSLPSGRIFRTAPDGTKCPGGTCQGGNCVPSGPPVFVPVTSCGGQPDGTPCSVNGKIGTCVKGGCSTTPT
jgi:hypothetical protein